MRRQGRGNKVKRARARRLVGRGGWWGAHCCVLSPPLSLTLTHIHTHKRAPAVPRNAKVCRQQSTTAPGAGVARFVSVLTPSVAFPRRHRGVEPARGVGRQWRKHARVAGRVADGCFRAGTALPRWQCASSRQANEALHAAPLAIADGRAVAVGQRARGRRRQRPGRRTLPAGAVAHGRRTAGVEPGAKCTVCIQYASLAHALAITVASGAAASRQVAGDIDWCRHDAAAPGCDVADGRAAGAHTGWQRAMRICCASDARSTKAEAWYSTARDDAAPGGAGCRRHRALTRQLVAHWLGAGAVGARRQCTVAIRQATYAAPLAAAQAWQPAWPGAGAPGGRRRHAAGAGGGVACGHVAHGVHAGG